MPSVSSLTLVAAASLRARSVPLLSRSAAPSEPRPGHAVEAVLVRRSVGALTAGRCRCHHCHRTPLLGERIHLYGAEVVCDLCRPRRRGAPDSSPLVRSFDHDRLVRPVAGT